MTIMVRISHLANFLNFFIVGALDNRISSKKNKTRTFSCSGFICAYTSCQLFFTSYVLFSATCTLVGLVSM